MVMLKDNHIAATGSIPAAVTAARALCGFSVKIEVECSCAADALAAAGAGADVVMLDNLQPDVLAVEAATVKQQFPHVIIEASGGIVLDRIAQYALPNVDIISVGSLTQNPMKVDFSLKIRN